MTTGPARPRPNVCGLDAYPQMAAVDAGIMRQLEAACRVETYRAGQTLIHEHESQHYVACVKSGFLRMQKSLSDGRQHIVGLLVEGDMFGRIFDEPQRFSIEAATDAEVCTFQRGVFEDLMSRSPDLEKAILLNILNELDRARDWMIILSCQKVTGRLAGFLLILATRFAAVDHIMQGRDGRIDVHIPISRMDLAHLLGTRTESISRALHALADEGHLEILRPDLIRILDIDALAAEAGDEELAGRMDLKGIVQMAQRRS
ncbi:MAG: Crp/Fnr family transcriptional regulator [Pseudooceanicola sp.]